MACDTRLGSGPGGTATKVSVWHFTYRVSRPSACLRILLTALPGNSQGMRAGPKELGDTSESSPENWEKAVGTTDVHVVSRRAVSPTGRNLT